MRRELVGFGRIIYIVNLGNMDVSIEAKNKDEVGMLSQSFASMANNITALVTDTNLLVVAAVEGRLDTRAAAAKHGGDYRRIVEGFNNTLDEVIEPVKEVSAVLQEMAHGNLQLRVTGNYQGDHADIKNAMNETQSLSRDDTAYHYVMPAVYCKGLDGLPWQRK